MHAYSGSVFVTVGDDICSCQNGTDLSGLNTSHLL